MFIALLPYHWLKRFGLAEIGGIQGIIAQISTKVY
jgi:hypothetical protein